MSPTAVGVIHPAQVCLLVSGWKQEAKRVGLVLLMSLLYTCLLVGITAILLMTVVFGLSLVHQKLTSDWVAAVSPLAVASGVVVWSVHQDLQRRKGNRKETAADDATL